MAAGYQEWDKRWGEMGVGYSFFLFRSLPLFFLEAGLQCKRNAHKVEIPEYVYRDCGLVEHVSSPKGPEP